MINVIFCGFVLGQECILNDFVICIGSLTIGHFLYINLVQCMEVKHIACTVKSPQQIVHGVGAVGKPQAY